MHNVLVLGAGLVARPLVRYLLDQPDIGVTVASRTVEKARKLIEDHPDGQAHALDVQDRDALREQIEKADLVVSLLPWIHHLEVAKFCLDLGKHLVTTSYIKPEMQALDDAVKDKGLIFLNEIGLDPGIDHMSAMRVIDRAHAAGGKVVKFSSSCGGLPSPEANNNPLMYKFSWSPRGVLLAASNPALYKKGGETVSVPGEDLMRHCWPMEIKGLGDFEVYPNRDSLAYIDTYGLHEAQTMFRGTIRYAGHCDSWAKMMDLGLFDTKERDLDAMTLKMLLGELLGGTPNPKAALVQRFGANDPLIEKLEFLGYFIDTPIGEGIDTPLDALCEQMEARMPYEEGERDMILLLHKFEIETDGLRKKVDCKMVEFGQPGGDSAMARTVALPAAIAVKLILEGEISLKGVWAPVDARIYNPVLDELETLGIVVEEALEV